MGWVVVIVIVAIVSAMLDSDLGKLVVGAGVVAIGMLLLSWILDVGFFMILAKICVVVIILIALGAILAGIFGN